MSKYHWCEKCGRYDRQDQHQCPPPWRAFIWEHDDVSDPEGGRVVYAVDAEQAAEECVNDRNDEGQYVGQDTLVLVRPEGREGDEEWVTIFGEIMVYWSSESAKPPVEYSPPEKTEPSC